MENAFKDCFSKVAAGYASFRPNYPAELFEWLARLPGERDVAWDCACGSGQATLNLAGPFRQVIATDASEAQIQSAPKERPNILWRVAMAEKSGMAAGSVDLVTVAQALHWFDLQSFYLEVNRVLRPGGVIAVWTYGVNTVEGERINELMRHFYSEVVGPYWPPERRMVEEGYRNLDFPFAEVEVPPFRMETRWTLDQLLGYLSTWSATTRYIAARGENPVECLCARLAPEWGGEKKARLICWPLFIRAGKKIDRCASQ